MLKIKTEKPLKDLIIASLMGNAYPNHDFLNKGISTLFVPYSLDKKVYISSFIKHHQLLNFVENNNESHELRIKIPISLKSYVSYWFEDQQKIFKRNFITEEDYQAIIIFINLFGQRQLEGVAISTTVEQRYLITLSFTIGRLLNVKTFLSNRSIKIPDITELFLETVFKTTSLDSSNIASYLLKKERKVLQKSIRYIEEKHRKDAYV